MSAMSWRYAERTKKQTKTKTAKKTKNKRWCLYLTTTDFASSLPLSLLFFRFLCYFQVVAVATTPFEETKLAFGALASQSSILATEVSTIGVTPMTRDTWHLTWHAMTDMGHDRTDSIHWSRLPVTHFLSLLGNNPSKADLDAAKEACPASDSLLTASNTQCGVGYEGVRCLSCAEGYGSSGPYCDSKCGSIQNRVSECDLKDERRELNDIWKTETRATLFLRTTSYFFLKIISSFLFLPLPSPSSPSLVIPRVSW